MRAVYADHLVGYWIQMTNVSIDQESERERLRLIMPIGTCLAIVEHAPNVVLIDIALRESLELVNAISNAPSAPRIVVFAVSDSKDALLPYIEAGIDGYVARDGSLADVVATVESVGRGETIASPKLAATLFQRLAAQRRRRDVGSGAPPDPDLTLRERQILSLVEQGMTNKEIARSLGIELATVKNHVHHMLEKLNVSRRGQAAARARERRTDATTFGVRLCTPILFLKC
ncbi:MAG TPA: response regulator transcription factor [Gemmatimonadaceae bacterium]|nr:response regulator transcription factor [Gemmatimonadaceae bacterium]